MKPALEVRKVPLGFEELFDASLRHAQRENKAPNGGTVVAGRALTCLANTRRASPDDLVRMLHFSAGSCRDCRAGECLHVNRKIYIRLHGKGNSKLPWRKAG